MNYIDGFIDAFPPAYDDEESRNEAVAERQKNLDARYRIGCQYGISMADSALLCQLQPIDFNELLNHSTTSTESTKCQSQQWSLDSLAPAKPQASAI